MHNFTTQEGKEVCSYFIISGFCKEENKNAGKIDVLANSMQWPSACACAARVTLVVCMSDISLLDRLFVQKILSRTQRATDVKNLWGFL